MAAAPQLPFVSEEEYLRTEYEPNCEYVDGVLELKALPGLSHSVLQRLLCCVLTPAELTHRIMVCPELHIRIRSGRHRVPDLALMPDTFATTDSASPLAMIDVVSPSDSWHTIRARIQDLHAVGCLWTIVADPERREVFVADADKLLNQVRPPLLVRLPLPERPDLVLDFDALFQQLPDEQNS
jgi:Uma2 family endonuclease